MLEMRVCRGYYETFTYYRNLKGADIHRLTDGQRRILKDIKELGLLNG